jgi:hypothetical protein
MSHQPFLYQTIENGILRVAKAMPQKDINSNGDSGFSQSREQYVRSQNVVQNKKWMGNRDSSSVTERRRFNAIGKSSINAVNQPIAFSQHNDINTTRDALIRVRSSGYVTTPKIRANLNNNIINPIPVIPTTVPTPPQNPTASAGDAEATVSWDAPADDGDLPITGYIIGSTPSTTTYNVDYLTFSQIFTGLTNGTSYVFHIIATNENGNSLPATTNSVIPAGLITDGLVVYLDAGNTVSYDSTTPTVWNNLIAQQPASFTVYNSPAFIANNGGYLSFDRNFDQYCESITTLPSTLTTWTIDIWYYYIQVVTLERSACLVSQIFNGSYVNMLLYTGESLYPDEQSGNMYGGFYNGDFNLTGPFTFPSPNKWYNLVVTVDINSLISLYANNVLVSTFASNFAPNGNSPLRLMRTWDNPYYLSGGIGVFRIYDRPLTTEEISNNYNYQQERFNVPSAPQNPTASAGNTEATITWNAPASNGSSAITGYTITSTPTTTTHSVNASTFSQVFTGLTNGTSYVFYIIATNATGNSSQATTNSVIPAVQNSGSAYFSDYANCISIDQTSNYALPFDSTSFTVEAWIYMTQAPDILTFNGIYVPTLIGNGPPENDNTKWRFGPLTNQTLSFFWGVDNQTLFNVFGSQVVPLNSWNHVAISVDANVIKLFVNGVEDTSLSGITTMTTRVLNLSHLFIGSFYPQASNFRSYQFGYVSNLRIVNGVAVYTGNFTVPTSHLTATQSASTNISAITTGQTTLLLNTQNDGNYTVDSSIYNLPTTIQGTVPFSSTTPF